ncbi:hypothetical protein ACSU1N_02760 [Thermogladius sp. 4427co]|uniref:hypothetical protein n=1 Tax=Thermogladius sp. 4427co TaxID=3450718 RepID=UPI003F7A4536
MNLGKDRLSDTELLDFLILLLAFESSGYKLPRLLGEVASKEYPVPEGIRILASRFKVLEKVIPDDSTALRKLAELYGGSRVSDFLRGYSEVMIISGDTIRYVESYLEQLIAVIRAKLENTMRIIESVFEGIMLFLFGLIALTIMPVQGLSTRFLLMLLPLSGVASYIVVLRVSEDILTQSSIEHIASIMLVFLTMVVYNQQLALIHLVLVALVFSVLSLRVRREVELEREVLTMLEEAFSMTKQGIPIDQVIRQLDFKNEELRLFKKSFIHGYLDGNILSKLPPFARRILTYTTIPSNYSSNHDRIVAYTLRFAESVRDTRIRVEKRGLSYIVYSLIFPAVVLISYTLIKPLASTTGFMLNRDTVRSIAYISFFNSFVLSTGVSGIGLFRKIKITLLGIAVMLIIVLAPIL